jgi:hypothetical protein
VALIVTSAAALGVMAPRAATAVPASAASIQHAAALALPGAIGVLDYMGERSRSDARPGASYSYRAAGLALDVDVFDYGAGRLPDGSASSLVQSELSRLERSLAATAGAQLLRTDTVTLGDATPIEAQEAVFARGGAGFDGTSYLWITAHGGHLYEMRLDVRAGFEDDGHVSRSESLAALGEAIAHPPAPATAAGPQLGVAILWDPSTPARERKLWTAYLYTRAAQVAQDSEDRPLPVGEPVATFDGEVRARLVAVSLFRQLEQEDPGFTSAYFADLERVQAAGFLREYVWRYLRQPSWTQQPDGLRLTEFDAWRTAHLRGHVPVTHGRIAVRLASATR